jgi:hypothetical protein
MEVRMVCGVGKVEVEVEVEGVECVKSEVKLKIEKEIPLPFSGVNELKCVALRKNGGLYTQCEGEKEKGEYCNQCDKRMKKLGIVSPEYGTVMDRMNVGLMEYVDPSGGKVIHYRKVMKRLKLSREEVEEEARRLGKPLEECHLEEEVLKQGRKRVRPKGEEEEEVKKESKKGRPKKEKNVIEEVEEADPEEDLFARLVLEAKLESNKEVVEEAMEEKAMEEKAMEESMESMEEEMEEEMESMEKEMEVNEVKSVETVVHKAIKEVVTKREAKPVVSKEEREAKKEADRVAKEAEREAKKEADRVAKEAERVAKEAEREAKKEADRVAKEAEREAKKEAERVAKEAERVAKEAERVAKKEADRLAKEAEREAKKEIDRLAKEALKAEKASEKVKKPKLEKKEVPVTVKVEEEKMEVEEVSNVEVKVEEKVEEKVEVKVEKVEVKVEKVEVKVEKVEVKVEDKVEVKVEKVEDKVEVKVEEKEGDVVKKIKFEGKTYLKSKKSGIVYDYEEYVSTGDQVMVGMWNEEKNCIMFTTVDSDSDSEEEEEEYEEDDC